MSTIKANALRPDKGKFLSAGFKGNSPDPIRSILELHEEPHRCKRRGYQEFVGRKQRMDRKGETIASSLLWLQHFLQHLTDLHKKTPPRFRGRLSRASAAYPDFRHFCLVFKRNRLFFVVLAGLEPATSPMWTVRSNQLNYKTIQPICLLRLLCLLCDSWVAIFYYLFHTFLLSNVSILYDLVAFCCFLATEKDSRVFHLSHASHVSILIATLLQHLWDSSWAIVESFKSQVSWCKHGGQNRRLRRIR